MSLNYLSEAFSQLNDILNEEDFNLNDKDSIEDVKSFLDMASDADENQIDIIDSEAETEDDIKDEYIGKVILDCCTCHSKQYKDKDEIVIDDEGQYANVGEECPFCYSTDGYKIVGEVAEYDEDEKDEDNDDDSEEDFETEEDKEYVDESFQTPRKLKEEKSTTLSDKEGTVSSFLIKNKNKIDSATSFNELVSLVEDILEDCPAAKAKQVIQVLKTKKNHVKALQYLYDLILKGDGLGTVKVGKGLQRELDKHESLEEDKQAADVISKYQRWVDFDMKRYGKISDKTNDLLKRAGLQVVKDDHGDYEVITNTDESLKEDFERVDIETDKEKMSMTADKDGRVEVVTEPKKEVMKPIDVETEEEIKIKSEESKEEENPEFDMRDIEDFDEESFDELGESYLKRVYENVNSYKTNQVLVEGKKLVIEGIITFNSGKKKATQFIFENKKSGSSKKRLIGENAQLTKGKKSFTVTGNIKDKKFITESFNYNYKAKDIKGNSTRLYGTMKRSK